jgi:hypothetical protein
LGSLNMQAIFKHSLMPAKGKKEAHWHPPNASIQLNRDLLR